MEGTLPFTVLVFQDQASFHAWLTQQRENAGMSKLEQAVNALDCAVKRMASLMVDCQCESARQQMEFLRGCAVGEGNAYKHALRLLEQPLRLCHEAQKQLSQALAR